MMCIAQVRYCVSLNRSRIGFAERGADDRCDNRQARHQRIEARSLIDQAAEIDELRAVAADLAHRLGGDDLAAVEIAAKEIAVDQRPGNAGQHHQRHAGRAIKRAVQESLGIGLQPRRHQAHDERRHSEQQEGDRLGRHIAPDRPDREGNGAAGQECHRRAPAHVTNPQQPAPSVRRHLRYGMQGHGLRQRQQRQQDAHQDQPAGHAENPGQERGRDHRCAERNDQRHGHAGLPRGHLRHAGNRLLHTVDP